MNNLSGIYEIFNSVNGKRYIGSAVDIAARWRKHVRELTKHIHHNAPLQHAWDKYGADTFSCRTILTCARSMRHFYEQQMLDKVRPEYNVALNAAVPMLGRKHSVETRLRMSLASKGRKHTPEHCANMGRARIGVALGPQTEATKRKISAAHKGKIKTREHCQAISRALTGKRRTPSQIEHLRIINTGRVLSAESREKIAASKRGKKRAPFTAQAKANMSAARTREAAARKALRCGH